MSKLPLPPIISDTGRDQRRSENHKEWLREITEYCTQLSRFQNDVEGGGDGVMATSEPNGIINLQVVENTVPDLKFIVKAGWGYHGGELVELAADFVSVDQTPPAGNPRIDVISINATTNLIEVTTGAEAGSPSAPAVPSGNIGLGEIAYAVAEAEINTGDITDTRDLLNV